MEVSLARFDTMPLGRMKQDALRRALCHANAKDWGAWSRALSEASDWEAEERKSLLAIWEFVRLSLVELSVAAFIFVSKSNAMLDNLSLTSRTISRSVVVVKE